MRRQDRTTRTKRERAAAAAERDRLMSLLPDVFTAIDASNAWGVGTQKTTSGLRKWFGDKARMQPKGEHRKQTGPGGVQSSMGLFDAS